MIEVPIWLFIVLIFLASVGLSCIGMFFIYRDKKTPYEREKELEFKMVTQRLTLKEKMEWRRLFNARTGTK